MPTIIFYKIGRDIKYITLYVILKL